MNFVVTGILDNLTRVGAETMIKDHGHQVSDTVRNTTDYLVVGIRPGSKLEKAKKLGITVLNEDGLMKMMAQQHERYRAEKARVDSLRNLPPVPAERVEMNTVAGTYFMIGEVSWDFNDEFFERQGSAVDPTKLFRTRSKAMIELKTLEQKAFKGHFIKDENRYSSVSCMTEYAPEGEGFGAFFSGRNYDYFRAVMFKYGIELPEEANDLEYGHDLLAKCAKMLCTVSPDKFWEAKRFMDRFSFYELKLVELGD